MNLKQFAIVVGSYDSDFGRYPTDYATLDRYVGGFGEVFVSPFEELDGPRRTVNSWQQAAYEPNDLEIAAICSYIVLRFNEESTGDPEILLAYERFRDTQERVCMVFDDASVRVMTREEAAGVVREAGHQPIWAD